MKVLLVLLVLVGITSACSPDQDINISTTTNHYYFKQVKDSIGMVVEFPTITDTIG